MDELLKSTTAETTPPVETTPVLEPQGKFFNFFNEEPKTQNNNGRHFESRFALFRYLCCEHSILCAFFYSACELGVFGHCSAHHRRKALFQWVLLPRTKGILWEALLSVWFLLTSSTHSRQSTHDSTFLTVFAQSYFQVEKLFDVSRTCFSPPPQALLFFPECDGVGNILFNAASSSLDVCERLLHSCESSCLQRLSARRFSKQKQVSSQESARVEQIQKLFLVFRQFPCTTDGQESLPSF